MKNKSITPLPDADFAPEMGNYRTLQPFRFWCQKVLPLVYDDSLSYYELLCKVVDYLNKTMEDVETLHGDVTNISTAYEELQNYVNTYFSSLDVQEEINNKLDVMANDGALYSIISRYTQPIVDEQNNKINVLESRMDTFASLPDGSTSGNAELLDIRVKADGTTATSAGNAVREQVSELKSDLSHLRYLNGEHINLCALGSTYISKGYNNGTWYDSDNFDSVLDIPVEECSKYLIYSNYKGLDNPVTARFVNFYNGNTLIKTEQNVRSKYISTPIGCNKLAITFVHNLSHDYYLKYYTYEPGNYIDVSARRMPTINFTFDDGTVNDDKIVEIFNEYDKTCGFGIITNDLSRIQKYLKYTKQGFSILSHSSDGTPMGTEGLTEEQLDTKMRGSRATLQSYGLNVKGWITPNSFLYRPYIATLEKYYDYGFTSYLGAYNGTGTPYNALPTKSTLLYRVSIESTTLENCKKAIDEVISNGGLLSFYGHSYSLDNGTSGNNLTSANLRAIISYAKTKESESRCLFLSPDEAMEYYFRPRYTDLIN